MCGRYKQTSPLTDLLPFLGSLDVRQGPYTEPAGVVSPGARGLVIRTDTPELMLWDFVPRWSKDGKKIINARSETIAEKPSFRDSFAQRRCIIPANGFFEWDKKPKPARPYDIHYADNAPFAMAGIWDSWTNPETGEVRDGFCIITTPALPTIGYIHDRMPAIFTTADECAQWLDPHTPAAALKSLLRPNDSALLYAAPADALLKPANADFPEDSKQLPLF